MTAVTKQETFDIVARHLLTQNKRAFGPRHDRAAGCVYRAPDGCKCAVGVLISDDQYSPSLEGQSVNSLDVMGVIEGHNQNLLVDLQCIHDQIAIGDWPRTLRETADLYNLSSAVVDELAPVMP